MMLVLSGVIFALLSIAFGTALLIQTNSKMSMWKMAYIDPLTEIGNLNKFKMDAERLIRNNPYTSYIIEKLNIDRFMNINETYGIDEGDLVLKDLAKSIEFVVDKKKDTFARVGLDEFAILRSYNSKSQLEKALILLENKFSEIHEGINSPMIRFPIGRYVIERGESDITKIIEKVEYAHQIAKKQKGIMLCLYDDEMKNTALYSREIELKMEDALIEGKFLVYLQPKFFLSDNSIIGAEALARWQYEGNNLIYPNSFVPLFEQNGFILKLDFYVVEKVCEVIKFCIDEEIKPVTISINFSRLHLQNHISFIRELCKIVDKHNVPREYIEIEFTESAIFDNAEVFADVFICLNNAGFSTSLDDFGTGYSSLGMLKDITVDVIKMDNRFFSESNDPLRSEIVISHIMLMAKNLDISTVAEGVETEEQVKMLKKVGCDIVQGYYYSKPLNIPDFTQLLVSRLKNYLKSG
ncbi:MAG: GGDEF domain-containing phosphodiesterase [Synergistaceae bacterium]|nr:GGDEF domain-containing phosphodiesterase [Synergistaceae bacterium]